LERPKSDQLINNSDKWKEFLNSVRNPLEKGTKKGLEAFSISPNPLK
jgi:hypothetical protein